MNRYSDLSLQNEKCKIIHDYQNEKLVALEKALAPICSRINVLILAGYTRFPDENEVVLAPGTKLRVVSNPLHHDGGLHVIHLEEIYCPKIGQTRSSSYNLLSTWSITILLLLLCLSLYKLFWS